MAERIHFFEAIDANKRNSYLLMALMFLLVFFCIFLISLVLFGSDYGALLIAIVVAAVYVYATYHWSVNLILSLSNAKEVSRAEYPYLYQITEGLAIASGIPMPKLYLINEAGMNAFAAGKDPSNSVIVVTRGLVETLSRRELSAVIAHEMSHIGNYDVRYAVIAVVMVGFIAILSQVFGRTFLYGGSGRKKGNALAIVAIIFLILAPIFAQLVRFALSREREYLADANGARLVRDPEALATALEKVSAQPMVQAASDVTASLYFENPLKQGFHMFATHPPVEKRIERLKKL